jgi:hypothetical protein
MATTAGEPRTWAERGFAGGNLLLALVLGLAVFRALPARWPWVDVPSALLVALLAASSGALFARARFALSLAKIAGFALLALGLAAVFALALSVAFLRGVFGSVGEEGVLLFSLSILFVLPYFVVYPLGLLAWTRSAAK